MKFLCLPCDEQMAFAERQQPGDGTFAASFTCPRCGRAVALLANPMETQLVSALGVRIGGSELDAPVAAPMELTRGSVAGQADAFVDARADLASGPRPRWSREAQERMSHVPSFVRGMVKRIYGDFARERGIEEITPEIMDRARTELGLEGM
jgi:hypothetical protein